MSIVSMIVRTLIRQGVNQGVRHGIRKMGEGSKRPNADMTPEERAQAQRRRQQQKSMGKGAQQAMRVFRRFGRF
ncbi:hypothetical protein [Tropicimonas sp. IMCC34011]|uniref:hypothetical protein n=1 Tax=Tropicimonas sp. IMCC34011 TaxID=2248759 RepID=UPI000E24E93A|nr:hypothetical protein [Tropicimonas sp. IMCC34011]